MKCPQCSHSNPSDFNFCEECAAPLHAKEGPPPGVLCTQCGHSNPSDFSFCEECAAPLTLAQKAVVQPPPKRVTEPEAVLHPEPPRAKSQTCPRCGHANLPDFNFCEECAAPLSTTAESRPKAPTQPLPAVPTPPRIRTGRVCTQCGFHNPPGVRFCGSCGKSLQVKPARRPTLWRRTGRALASLASTLLFALISAAVTRYAVPYIMNFVTHAQTAHISETQAVRAADGFVRAEYADFLGVNPSVQLALDGSREIYAVAYARGSGASATTLVVLVDAKNGHTELFVPD